jgi:hypothetical protein
MKKIDSQTKTAWLNQFAKKVVSITFLLFNIYGAFAQNVGIGLGNTSATNKLEVVDIVTSSSAATIFGTNTASVGNGVYGVSHAAGTSGVRGNSNFGVGVYGYSNNYIALGAGALAGTAVYANSTNGLGLNVSGKIQMTGGDTNPTAGGVLTSDAIGNAVWKPKQIGFFANSAANTSIPTSVFRKVEFSVEDFDLLNDFVPYPGATSPSTSVFTAPVAGIYHFAASVLFQSSESVDSGQIRLIKNTSSTVLANYEGQFDQAFGVSTIYYVPLDIEGDFYLAANDKVWVEVAQRNIFGNALALSPFSYRGRFSGYIKIAD